MSDDSVTNRFAIAREWLNLGNARTIFNDKMKDAPHDSFRYKMNKEQDDYCMLEINKLLNENPWLYDVMTILDVGA